MNDALAIAAVMERIRSHLDQQIRSEFSGVTVTLLSPEDLVKKTTGTYVNLFLYELRPNAAFRNQPLPGRGRDGETLPPPLPLDLTFLLSAFIPQGSSQLDAYRLLGCALSVLHDTPVLGRIELDQGPMAPYRYPHAERVRVSPQALTLEQLTGLWNACKGPIVPSMAYCASVVLMESRQTPRIPAPVLRRGDGDRGAVTAPDVLSPFPAIESLTTGGAEAERERRRRPKSLPVFEWDAGIPILVRGSKLLSAAGPTRAFLRIAIQEAPAELPVTGATETELEVTLDPQAANMPKVAGHARLFVQPAGESGRAAPVTPEVPLLIAPRIRDLQPAVLQFPQPAAGEPREPWPLTVICDVPLQPRQRVSLLLAGREVLRDPPGGGAPADNATFHVSGEISPGRYALRLRVDGVDSLPIFGDQDTLVIGREVSIVHQ